MAKLEPSRARWVAALTLGALVYSGRDARGDDDLGGGDGRTLAGHRYVPSSLVSWPFITTDVSSISDAGETTFTFTPTALRLRQPLTGSYIEVDQALSTHLAPASWFALELSASGAGLMPLSKTAAVLVGGFGALGLQLGAALRIVHAGPLELVVRGAVGENWIEGVVPSLLPGAIRVDGTTKLVRGSAAAAVTVTPRVGLQVSGTFQGNRFDLTHDDTSSTIEGGAAMTFDLAPAPLMVLVAGGVASKFGRDLSTTSANIIFGEDETRWSGEVGLYYHGRADLDIGASYRFLLEHSDLGRSFGQVRLAYYF